MIDTDALNVWHENQLVGYLWRNTVGYIGFRYDEKWVQSTGFAISHSLPLKETDFSPEQGIAQRFFANLLPEGIARDHIVRDLKIPNTDFDLLRAIGGECAGALSILPVETTPSANGGYYPLSEEELDNLIARRGQIYTRLPSNKRPRLSLAGAQHKCPVLLRDGKYYLPETEAPTTHILKFEITDYRHLPAYETYTTLLAKLIGLPVVDIKLQNLNKQFFAQIHRYDRATDNQGQVKRIHQEDFCQALGIGHEKKYQESGGPSFANCFRLLQDISTDPIIDSQNLLRWQIFNVLAGNSDGHAKNLSLLYQVNGDVRLAPFYDLICTRAIERIDYHLAFDIGGQRNPEQITQEHWNTLAKDCDVMPRYVKQQVIDVATSLLDQIDEANTIFNSQYEKYPSLTRINQIVKQQCTRVLKK